MSKLPTVNEDYERKRALDATKDTTRLDWIARQGEEFLCGVIQDRSGDGDYFVYGRSCVGEGKTFRKALDAAMKAQK